MPSMVGFDMHKLSSGKECWKESKSLTSSQVPSVLSWVVHPSNVRSWSEEVLGEDGDYSTIIVGKLRASGCAPLNTLEGM